MIYRQNREKTSYSNFIRAKQEKKRTKKDYAFLTLDNAEPYVVVYLYK